MFGYDMDEVEVKVFLKSTGEEIKTVTFKDQSSHTWEKVVAKQLASMFEINGNSSTKFISFVLGSKDLENRFYGTYTEMSKQSGVSVGTIRKLMPKLIKNGFVRSVHRSGVYMVNPEVIRPGARWKGSVLFQSWAES